MSYLVHTGWALRIYTLVDLKALQDEREREKSLIKAKYDRGPDIRVEALL